VGWIDLQLLLKLCGRITLLLKIGDESLGVDGNTEKLIVQLAHVNLAPVLEHRLNKATMIGMKMGDEERGLGKVHLKFFEACQHGLLALRKAKACVHYQGLTLRLENIAVEVAKRVIRQGDIYAIDWGVFKELCGHVIITSFTFNISSTSKDYSACTKMLYNNGIIRSPTKGV